MPIGVGRSKPHKAISFNWSTGLTRFPSLLLSFVLHSLCLSYYKKRKHLFSQNSTVSIVEDCVCLLFLSLLFRSHRCILQFLLFFHVCWLYKQLTLLLHNPGSRSTSSPKILPSFVVSLGSNYINITITCHFVWLLLLLIIFLFRFLTAVFFNYSHSFISDLQLSKFRFIIQL